MRICSGEFDAGMDAFHIQGGKKSSSSQPQMMASERKMIEKKLAAILLGILIRIFSIGDTITTSQGALCLRGDSDLAPNISQGYARWTPAKWEQFIKGINQIAQEGAIQIFQEFNTGMEEIIVGVVGVLQFDVPKATD